MDLKAADQMNARYVAQTIVAAAAGDVEAAEEALSLFRSAVDGRLIDGASEVYRQLAEYIAECFWKYDQGSEIARALHLHAERGRGQPKGTCKVNQDSYAALMILLARRLGSANKAKDAILEEEQGTKGKGLISRRTLDTIHTSYAPARELDHAVLVTMLSPAHRKLFSKSLR